MTEKCTKDNREKNKEKKHDKQGYNCRYILFVLRLFLQKKKKNYTYIKEAAFFERKKRCFY